MRGRLRLPALRCSSRPRYRARARSRLDPDARTWSRPPYPMSYAHPSPPTQPNRSCARDRRGSVCELRPETGSSIVSSFARSRAATICLAASGCDASSPHFWPRGRRVRPTSSRPTTLGDSSPQQRVVPDAARRASTARRKPIAELRVVFEQRLLDQAGPRPSRVGRVRRRRDDSRRRSTSTRSRSRSAVRSPNS